MGHPHWGKCEKDHPEGSATRQLTQVNQGATTESYSYDNVGNRLSSLGLSPYQYNSSNQLTSTPNATFTYDNNGNTLTKTDSNGVTGYTWDYENRLTSVTLPGLGGTVMFKYDPFGRRIQKVSGAGTTIFVYDGANVVDEVNAAGAVTAQYAQGTGIDEPLAAILSGTLAFYEGDGLGSITSTTNTSGSAVGAYIRDSFGKAVSTADTLGNRYRYTAREWDEETGLYYYRARYYDPQLGRFVSEDPLEQLSGPNLYEYVDNHPSDFVDPSGLSPKIRYRWRYCKGDEVRKCKAICDFQGKKYVSCRVSQTYRIGPLGWSVGPDWIDGVNGLSCNCAEKNECNKASVADPKAAEDLKLLFIGVGVGAGIAAAPEAVLPALPVLLPKLVPAFLH